MGDPLVGVRAALLLVVPGQEPGRAGVERRAPAGGPVDEVDAVPVGRIGHGTTVPAAVPRHLSNGYSGFQRSARSVSGSAATLRQTRRHPAVASGRSLMPTNHPVPDPRGRVRRGPFPGAPPGGGAGGAGPPPPPAGGGRGGGEGRGSGGARP